jgi:hypothetical protein
MNTAWRSVAAAAAAVAFGAQAARAADVGDLIFPADLGDATRAELIYENVTRGMDASQGGRDFEADFEADLVFLRIHTGVGPSASLDFDVGTVNPSGGDYALYGGAGLRYLAYDAGVWRCGAFAQIHYGYQLEAEDAGPDGADTGEADLLDVDAGVLVSGNFDLGGQIGLMPYAGPIFSKSDLDGDAGFDAEEDQSFGAAVGLGLRFAGGNGIRAEARILDDVSYSIAAGLAF